MPPAELFALIVGAAFGAGSAVWLTRRYVLYRPNFQGRPIPQMAGLFILFGGAWAFGFEWMRVGPGVASTAAFFLVTVCFGFLGAWDDLRGSRVVGGFRGHLRALKRGTLTTGAAKLIGGGVTALVAGGLVGWPHTLPILLAALLVALSANTLNLLDTRPGRCLAGFFAGAIVLTLTLAARHSLASGFLMNMATVAAVALYPLDRQGRVMLGDTGSNALGAILGVGAALWLPLWAQALTVLALVGFNVWCEKHSLSRTIEQNTFLRRLDSKVGVR